MAKARKPKAPPAEPARGRGRPKKDDALSEYIATRVGPNTLGKLQAAAVKLEREPAWIIRKALEEWLEKNS